MSELSNIARPYAQAVFEIARESDRFDEWSDSLEILSTIVSLSELQALISNPRITREQVLDIVLEIGANAFDEQSRNFVRILSHYRRLPAAPLIASQYENLRAEAEGIIGAELETAYEINDEQRGKLIAALETRLGRKVRLSSKLDENLIGGAVIRAGDWVIDGSIRARLEKLSSYLGV